MGLFDNIIETARKKKEEGRTIPQRVERYFDEKYVQRTKELEGVRAKQREKLKHQTAREQVYKDIKEIKAARSEQKYGYLKERARNVAKGTGKIVKGTIGFVDDVLPKAPKGKQKRKDPGSILMGGGADMVFGGGGVSMMGSGSSMEMMMGSPLGSPAKPVKSRKRKKAKKKNVKKKK